MVWLPDGYAMSRLQQTFGWRRVLVSQEVWDHFIRVPRGVGGQSEELRIWDLLIFLRAGIEDVLMTRESLNRVGFVASVVNDDRDFCVDKDAYRWTRTNFELAARTGFDETGSPFLAVTFRHEHRLR